MKALAYLGGVALGFMALIGCGPTCQNTCSLVYNDCGITKPGQDTPELLRRCNQQCTAALKEPGELGNYNPDVRRSSAATIQLENEVQAAAWMDCVWARAADATPEQCQELDPTSGYCAPI